MANFDAFKAEFSTALASLSLTLGDPIATDEELVGKRILAYYEILVPYGREAVLSAIRQAAGRCKFFPKPAELIEIITGGKGGGQDSAVAWQVVVRALEDIGAYSNVEFSDGAVAAAIEGLGGWVDLCRMSYDDLSLQRIPARFAALYAEAVRHGRHLEPGRLCGSLDRDNAARGFSLESSFIRAKTMSEIQSATRNRNQFPAAGSRPALDYKPNPNGPIHPAAIALAVSKRLN